MLENHVDASGIPNVNTSPTPAQQMQMQQHINEIESLKQRLENELHTSAKLKEELALLQSKTSPYICIFAFVLLMAIFERRVFFWIKIKF